MREGELDEGVRTGGWKRRRTAVGRSLTLEAEAEGAALVDTEIETERNIEEGRNRRRRTEEDMTENWYLKQCAQSIRDREQCSCFKSQLKRLPIAQSTLSSELIDLFFKHDAVGWNGSLRNN